MLTVGSLFAGIGGFVLGFERTGGFRTEWFCEQDPYCRRVLEKHWPGVPCYYDVRDLGHHDAPAVDVLCGGFPCQDISVAGAGAGLAGARSGLWSEYARLVGELRPRYVVVENVSALLARGLGTVLGDLAALGYDAEWDCIPASALGAPHQRDRVWLVAYPGGDDGGSRRARRLDPSRAGQRESERTLQAAHPGGQRPVADARGQRGAVGGEAADVAQAPPGGQGAGPERQRDGHAADDRGADVADADDAGREERRGPFAVRAQQPSSECRGEVADAGSQGLPGRDGPGREVGAGPPGGAERRGAVEQGHWAVEPDVGRVADGVPARVDRLRSLGNALVPQIAELIGRRILDYESGVTA